MKVFFASQSFYPHIGGVSTYLLNLAKGLMERGTEVVEVHLRTPHEPNEEEVKGIRVFRIPKEPLKDELLKGYSNFKERIYKECHGEGEFFKKELLITYGYDEYNTINSALGEQVEELLEKNPTEIVHIHDFQMIMLYRNIPRGIPVVLTWHIPFIDSISKHLKQFLIRHMREYDKIIFSCEEYAQSAIRAGLPRSKVEIIHPIADTKLFRPRQVNGGLREKYSLPEKSKIILCVQRIDPKSGHAQLIEAMPKVLKQIPDAVLMFVGGDSMTSKISKEREDLVRKVHELVGKNGLGNNVVFAGNVPYEELPLYYNSADVVVLTSRNEGFGLAITEGMSCGKPVVGTNVPGIALQVENGRNGYLVKVGNSSETAERIVEILTDENLRQKMGQESLQIVKERFDMSIGIDKHHTLYRSLIKEKSDWRLEKIKLEDVSAIVTDFDRTITDEPGDVNEKVLAELESLDKPLVLVTGRSFGYVRSFYKKYPVWDCVISENGSCVYFPHNELLWRFTSEKFERAKLILKEKGFPAQIQEGVVSVSRAMEKNLKVLLKQIRGSLGFSRNVDEVMVLPRGIDKGASVKLALSYMGIDVKRSIIVGDGENDVDLFTLPGYKIAVANAAERLKRFADEITKAPSSSGVLEVIGKLKM